MLDGINVLNEYFITKSLPWYCFIVFFICLFICISMSFEESIKSRLLGVLFGFCSILSLVCASIITDIPSDTKEYQVTIDESVSMVDFASKYDIVRVDGEIYTIREKEINYDRN